MSKKQVEMRRKYKREVEETVLALEKIQRVNSSYKYISIPTDRFKVALRLLRTGGRLVKINKENG